MHKAKAARKCEQKQSTAKAKKKTG